MKIPLITCVGAVATARSTAPQVNNSAVCWAEFQT